MEEVEHAFFRSIGLSVAMQHEGKEIGWPRRAVSCEYSGPVRFEDEVELRMRVIKLGERSFTYEVDFLKGGQAVAKGKVTSVHCAVDPRGGFTATPIPPAIRERLEKIVK